MPSQYAFQILAPHRASRCERFSKVEDGVRHNRLLRSLQRFRGQIYLEDGAIKAADLDGDGALRMRGDDEAWHLLLIDSNENVIGCARYLMYSNTTPFESLWISRSALAQDPLWASHVRKAIEADLNLARARNQVYVEIGGWALKQEWRCTRAALEIAIGSFAMGSLWGGAVGACSATFRHGSASILNRLGGGRLHCEGLELPSYYDPQYGCMMELLRFDHASPEKRFEPLLRQLTKTLSQAQLITAGESADRFANSLLALAATTQSSVVPARPISHAIDSLADEVLCLPDMLRSPAHCSPGASSPN